MNEPLPVSVGSLKCCCHSYGGNRSSHVAVVVALAAVMVALAAGVDSGGVA